MSKSELSKSLNAMTVRDLMQLNRALERMLGIPPQRVVVRQRIEPPPEPDKTEVDVVLTGLADGAKIPVIRALRAELGLGLRETRDLVDAAPSTLREAVSPEAAEALATVLREAGAVIAIG